MGEAVAVGARHIVAHQQQQLRRTLAIAWPQEAGSHVHPRHWACSYGGSRAFPNTSSFTLRQSSVVQGMLHMYRLQGRLACSDGVQEGDEVVAHGRRQLLRQPEIQQRHLQRHLHPRMSLCHDNPAAMLGSLQASANSHLHTDGWERPKGARNIRTCCRPNAQHLIARPSSGCLESCCIRCLAGLQVCGPPRHRAGAEAKD